MKQTAALKMSKSQTLHTRASAVLPGGVNASARTDPALGHPIFMDRGEGAHVFDIDGNRYIDFWTSHGATMLGHGHPAIVAAVEGVLTRGILCAAETELQVEVAERLITLFPGSGLVRYSGSGTEATWHALRIARAFTGKSRVAKFEGHFHGINDTVGYSCWPPPEAAGPADAPKVVPESAGMPPGNGALVTVLPFNDPEVLENTLRAQKDTLAAVILEPVNFDSGGIRPKVEYLKALRALTAELGIVLVFDEVLSGFRAGPGSIVKDTGVYPDLTVLGKAIGGGMPLSIILGKREIMQGCSPVGGAVHSGTYNAHLSTIAAAKAFLDVIAQPGFYAHLDALGRRLYPGLREIFARHGIKAWVQAVGCRFGIYFGLDAEPHNYRDTLGQSKQMMERFHLACLRRGLYLHHWSPHHGFSSAHTAADIDEALDIMDRAAAEIA